MAPNLRSSADDDDAKVAWRLLTELQTRITTQALPLRDGVEETALDSVVDFFRLARQQIGAHPGCASTAALVVRALNEDIRPFTARWHARKLAGRMSSADHRYAFRSELRDVQARLRELAAKLAEVAEADVSTWHTLTLAPATLPPATPPQPFGIRQGDAGARASAATIDQLNGAEAADIRLRRKHYEVSNADKTSDAVGLALSGGGIRSATFALGVVQQLARRGVLRQVDYLSTVSGGGYLGSFITAAMDDPDPAVGLAPGKHPFGAAGEPESQAVRHLRNHGKYLAEGGLRTLFEIGFSLLYGLWVSLVLALPVLLLGAVALVYGAPDLLQSLAAGPGWRRQALQWLPAVLLVVAAAYSFMRGRDALRKGAVVAGWVLAAVLAVTAALVVPALYVHVKGQAGEALGAAALLPLAIGALVVSTPAGSMKARLLTAAMWLAGPLFFLALLMLCVQAAAWAQGHGWHWAASLAAVAALFAYATCGIDLNFASLHRFYRDRLARTYLILGGRPGRPTVEPQDRRKLSQAVASAAAAQEASRTTKAPVHLINAALNVPGAAHPELGGRDSVNFVFGKHFTGSTPTGWHATRDWEQDEHLDLGTAMAISGAAAAPNMGRLTERRYTVLLGMLNMRLCYWLRKPSPGTSALVMWLPPAAWWYFLKELTGSMTERSAFVNVSDGGHFENLGIYELLRRRCRTIVAIDGECDPQHQFGGLLTLARMALIDFNIRIEPDLSDLRLNAQRLTNAHFIATEIHYPDGGKGTLLYVKLSMTGNEGEYLRQHWREHPAFPHDTTAQQLYGESQWEAYRALGEHVGEDLFAEHLFGGQPPPAFAVEWAERLCATLRR